MAMQLSIDEKDRQGQERKQGVVAVWAAVKAIAILDAFGRVVMQVFEGIRSAQMRGGKRKQMKLVESLQLGNRRQLLLIVCDNQRYLVGAGADSVGSILAMEAGSISRDRAARGPELVRRRGRDANHEARSKTASEPELDLWH